MPVDALRFVTGDEVGPGCRRSGATAICGAWASIPPMSTWRCCELRSGAVATLENSSVLPPDSPMVFDFRIEVVGERGAVQISTANNGAFRKFTGGGLRSADLFGATPAAARRIGGFVYEAIAQFVDAGCRRPAAGQRRGRACGRQGAGGDRGGRADRPDRYRGGGGLT